jgi:GntR family transcriptional regulator, transcriptional repressor for pyruvate dehydrogenase complex
MILDLVPIVKTTSAQQVAQQLLAMIRQGALKPGDRLPPERQLMESLGIGRSSVREGLQILATLNVIYSSPGQGTFIREPRAEDALRVEQIGFLINNVMALDLLEARKIIESQSVRFACLRATEAQLRPIDTLLSHHRRALDHRLPTSEFAAKFHVLLAESSCNSVFGALMGSIVGLLRARGDGSQLSEELRELELAEHHEIVRLIRAGEPDAAAEYVTSHIVRWAVYYDVVPKGEVQRS